MSEFDEIGRIIKDIAHSGLNTSSIVGLVDKVDVAKFTCVVKSMDGMDEFVNVRLKEVTDLTNKTHGIILVPKVGSRVVLEKMGLNQTYITMYSEIDFYQSVVGDDSNEIRVSLSKTGIGLENTKASADLKDTLDMLIDTLSKFQVQTAWGPSGPPLKDYTDKLSQVKDNLSKIIVKGADNKAQ